MAAPEATMVPVVDFGRSFCTQSALRFDTDDPAEVGVPGNVCRAQILATCAITRWPSEEAQAASALDGPLALAGKSRRLAARLAGKVSDARAASGAAGT